MEKRRSHWPGVRMEPVPSGEGASPHRFFPIVGGVALLAALIHILPIVGGGVAIFAVLDHLPVDGLRFGLAIPVVAKLLLIGGVLGAAARASRKRTGITTGSTIHWARFYDPIATLLTLGRARALREATIDLAHIHAGDTVLDIGCGTGEVTMRAKARSGPHGAVFGIDPAPEMIAVARKKSSRAGLAVDYQVAAAEALPFPDATFDRVLSSLMMHHLPDDLKPRVFAEIRRVLKPNGQLLVVDFKPPTNARGGRRLVIRFLHHRPHSPGGPDLPALVSAAGFDAVEAGRTNFTDVAYMRARVDG